jgi:hypothetical protein
VAGLVAENLRPGLTCCTGPPQRLGALHTHVRADRPQRWRWSSVSSKPRAYDEENLAARTVSATTVVTTRWMSDEA